MKKQSLAFACLVTSAFIISCNSGENTTTATTTNTSDTSAGAITNNTANNSSTTGSAAGVQLPLNAADSTFLMKAAAGGLMEVEAGQTAQQNAQNERVKAFGSMMVNDHNRANQELMGLASARGLTLPASLPKNMQDHIEAMRKMQGKSFDKHYMGMMVQDHNKDVSEFEKAFNSANDPEIKAWAAKTLPVLKMHQDSAKAINSSIK